MFIHIKLTLSVSTMLSSLVKFILLGVSFLSFFFFFFFDLFTTEGLITETQFFLMFIFERGVGAEIRTQDPKQALC